jgi:RNA polymerase sigma-70 factor (ECF subfamily)
MEKHLLEQYLADHHREAYLWARQCCRYDDEQAKDVLQAACLKIWEGRAHYNNQSSFRTWLFAVIRYTALDSLREKHPTIVDEPGDHLGLHADEPPEEPVDYEALLQQLPARQAQVLLLAFYHNMTLEAIATVMDISLGTVRTHYDRGKKQLKELLSRTKVQDHGRR